MSKFIFVGSSQGKYERGLLNHLLMNYNVLERPVANESDPLVLSFGLTLMQIIDVVSVETKYLPPVNRSMKEI